MAIYHDQAVQFLINQLNRVSANLRMQECRPMNHHEKNQNLYAHRSHYRNGRFGRLGTERTVAEGRQN